MLQPTTSDLSNRPECLVSAIMRFSLRWEESWVSIDLIRDCDSTQLLTAIFILFTIRISTEMLKCHLKCKCSGAIWLLGQDCIVDISILHSTTPHLISPILLLLLLSYNYLLCIKSQLSREQIQPSNIIIQIHTHSFSSILSLQLIWSLELLFVSFESNF